MRTKTVTETIGGGEVMWEEPGTVLGVAFSGDGRTLAAACEDGSALVWDALACTPSTTTPWPSGHPQAVAASPDGKWLAVGGQAGDACDCVGVIRIHDAKTGRVARTIETSGPVGKLAFAADSRRLACTSDCSNWFADHCVIPGQAACPLRADILAEFARKRPEVMRRSVEIWDATTGERTTSLDAPDTPVLDLDFVLDNQLLGCSGDSVILWDASSGKRKRTWSQLGQWAASLSVSPDGQQFAVVFASGSWDIGAKVMLGDVGSDTAPQALELPTTHRNVSSLAFTPKGEQLVAGANVQDAAAQTSASPTGSLILWALKSPGEPKLVPTVAPVNELVALPDNQHVVVKSSSSHLRVLNLATGDSRLMFAAHQEPPLDFAVLPDQSLATVGYDQRLKTWRLSESLGRTQECETCSPPRLPPIAFKPPSYDFVKRVRMSRDGRFAAISGHTMVQVPQPIVQLGQTAPAPTPPKYNGVVHLYDAKTGREVDTITIPDAPRMEFDLSADGRWVVMAKQDGVAVVWDRDEKKAAAECRGHTGAIHAIAFHPDGAQFATAGQDSTVRLWTRDGDEVGSVKHESPVMCLAFDPTGKVLAAGDQRGNVRLWDCESKTTLHELTGHYGELLALSFNGDGSRLATTSRRGVDQGWEGDLKVWNVTTGEKTLDIPAHTWWEADVAFHPTEPHIAMTGKQHTLQVLHAETGQLLLSLPTQGHLCNTMMFTPDGTRLLVNLAGTPKLIDARPVPQPLASARASK